MTAGQGQHYQSNVRKIGPLRWGKFEHMGAAGSENAKMHGFCLISEPRKMIIIKTRR